MWCQLQVINHIFIALHMNGSNRTPAKTLWSLSFLLRTTVVSPPKMASRNNGTAARASTANMYASRGEEHAWCHKRLFYQKHSKLILSWFTYPLSLLLVFQFISYRGNHLFYCRNTFWMPMVSIHRILLDQITILHHLILGSTRWY